MGADLPLTLTKLSRWHKILNSDSQRQGRAEWFRERRGRHASFEQQTL